MQRISPGTLILGIFAILFGLVGAYAAKKYLQGNTKAAPTVAAAPKAETWRVPTALIDLPEGRTITQADLVVLTMTPEDAAKRKLPSMWLDKPQHIIGRTLREPLKQGQAFSPTVFYPVGIGPAISEKLQPGQCAVTIPFVGTSADCGLVTPGAIVDVMFRSVADEKKGLPDATVTLLSRIKVLAVGNTIQEGSTGGTGSVTLAVNEIQARALKVVEGCGSMMLTLRGMRDTVPAERIDPTTLQQLLGIRENDKPFTTQIFHRGRVTTQTFEEGRRTNVVADPPFGMPVAGLSPMPATEDTTMAAPATPAGTVAAAARTSGARSEDPVRKSAGPRSPKR